MTSRALFPLRALSELALRAFIFHLALLQPVMPPAARAQSEPPFILPEPAEINKLRRAIIYTERGNIEFELFPADAPWHVANFKYRADKGLYRNTVFQIYYPDYIIQGGGPRNNPSQSAPYTLPPEFNEREHVFGTLGMARKPDLANPQRHSSGNQFHILLGDARHMNGNFTIFGQAIGDLKILEKLGQGDGIKDIRVFVVE